MPTTGGKGLKPYDGEWGQTQILHLLRRSLFGVSGPDYEFFSTLTLFESLDVLLKHSPVPDPPVNLYNDNVFSDPDIPFGHTWVHATVDESDGAIADFRRSASMKAWWVGLMLDQERSLTEKMTLFWSNNLATQGNIVKEARYSYRYVSLLRTHALGNFKALTRKIVTEPAMLLYLNGSSNTASAPNENFSRELQELFTVGKGPNSHYTQADVETAARVLTGWNVTGAIDPKGTFIPANHDPTDKQFSSFYNNTIIKGQPGINGALETDQLIDMIFDQRETAINFCRKLYRWFVYYVIDIGIEENVINPLADILISNDFNVSPVLRVLLGSEHFFDSRNIGCQIKNPIDMLIGACRQFQVILPTAADPVSRYQICTSLVSHLKDLGMEPQEPLTVAGWPAYYQHPSYYEFWINSNSLPIRNYITDTIVSQSGLQMTSTFALRLDLLAYTSRLSDPANLHKFILESIAMLLSNHLGPMEIDYLKTILLSGQTNEKYWSKAWGEYIKDGAGPQQISIVGNRLIRYYSYVLQRVEYQLM
jgi:uncharacterized protein (DUF1800 family)